jgi:hypothetical protein
LGRGTEARAEETVPSPKKAQAHLNDAVGRFCAPDQG